MPTARGTVDLQWDDPATITYGMALGDAPARAALVVVTHQATDEALSATVEELGRLGVVQAVASVMRVEGE